MRFLVVGLVATLVLSVSLATAEETAPTADGETEAASSSEPAPSAGESSPSSQPEPEPQTNSEPEPQQQVQVFVAPVVVLLPEPIVESVEDASGVELTEESATEPSPQSASSARSSSSQPETSSSSSQTSSSSPPSGTQGRQQPTLVETVAQSLPLRTVETLPLPLPDLKAISLAALPPLPELQGDAEPVSSEGTAGAEAEPIVAASLTAAPQTVNPLVALVAATIVVGATASVAVWSTPAWQKALLRAARWIGVGALFTRLSDDDLLNHPRRNEITEYVRQNPGERLESVRRALNLSNGSMLHHVRILNARNLVRIVREGSMTRLYPAGPRIQSQPYVPAARRRLLELVQTSPGRTQREIANLYGASERMVSYHLGQLRADGLVDVRRDGAAKRCFPLASDAG